MTTDDIESGATGEPYDDAVTEASSRARAWTQIVLVSLGIFVVGTSLLVVLWMLFTSTLALLQAAF